MLAKSLTLFVACLFAAGLLVATEQQVPQEPKVSKIPQRADDTELFMRAKLGSSQKVMEGLVTEDFALITAGASQMKKISEASHWPTTVDEVYQHYSFSFRKQCDKLVDQSNERNLQAAHYTYLQLSTTCIDCHSYVRGRFRVKNDERGGPVRLIPTQWDGPVKKIPRPSPDDKKGNVNRENKIG